VVKRKMHSMIPSERWYAVYDDEMGNISYAPLVCWAHARVIETDNEGTMVRDAIVGMVGHQYVECAEEVVYFAGYVHEAALPEDFNIHTFLT
jgi:hypothetical protein